MSVASKQLGAVKVADTSLHTAYTVPAGYRTIIKSVVVKNQAAAAQQLLVAIFSSGGTEIAELSLHPAATGSDGETIILLPWIVMNAGQYVQVKATNASGAYFLLSGAELELP